MTNLETTASSFRLVDMADDLITGIRQGAADAWNRPAVQGVAEGGEPVRCCRRDADAGEPLLLFGFRPPLPGTGSPYEEAGPVFVHADPCERPAGRGEYPPAWRGRPQVLRAYDDRGWIHPASRAHDGIDPERHLSEVLATPGVVEVHSRNIAYGCWMFAAVSASTGSAD